MLFDATPELVVSAEVAPGRGSLAGEEVTTATLRRTDGRERVVRIVGGPRTHIAGFVVPAKGMTVRADLRAVSLDVHAFTTNAPAGTWATPPITFVVAGTPSRDVGAEASAELAVALRAWTRPSCTSWRANAGPDATVTPGDDGVNGVFFHDDAWPSELIADAVGQTVVHTDAGGRYHDADIHLDGAAFHFSLDGKDGTLDLRSVLTHELGHALGLGHATDPRATMYPTGSGLRWRSLEQDDVNGVCALYPGDAGAPGCDVDPCPAPLLCVAGECQRPHDRADVCSPCARTEGACEAAGDGARCIDLDGGRACGRLCATDAECGAGFHCKPTSEAGDLQCVSDTDCANGASTCATDVDCTDSTCHGGACLGPGDPAPLDAGTVTPPRDAGDDDEEAYAVVNHGCGCRAAGSRGAPTGLLFALVLAMRLRRRMQP